eukprot:Rhum_TRINITY_DN22978_c0_g1::Rhum_TRINITY_DN22978_c0_g1_i1::g.176722::m.176722
MNTGRGRPRKKPWLTSANLVVACMLLVVGLWAALVGSGTVFPGSGGHRATSRPDTARPLPEQPAKTPQKPAEPQHKATGEQSGDATAPAGGLSCTFLSLSFSRPMVDAWKNFAGEKGAVFAGENTKVAVASAPEPCRKSDTTSVASSVPARVQFWGKSSAKLRLTKRRSLLITVDAGSPPLRVADGAPPLRRFLLMSLWEDTYRLAYATTARFLEKSGVWLPYTKLVEVHCEGGSEELCGPGSTFGVYLLIEFPEDAIRRRLDRLGDAGASFARCAAAHGDGVGLLRPPPAMPPNPEVGARIWRYQKKPAFYDVISFPSFASNSSLSALYKRLDQTEERSFVKEVGRQLHLQQYLVWLALNSLLRNGDYDDEVFFVGSAQQSGSALRIHAWDFDNVYEDCHKKGKHALKGQPLMYCAETALDKRIAGDKTLLRLYKQTLSCVLRTHGSHSAWKSALSHTLAALLLLVDNPQLASPTSKQIAAVSYEAKAVPDFRAGAARLSNDFSARWDVLNGLLEGDGLAVPATEGGGSSSGGSDDVDAVTVRPRPEKTGSGGSSQKVTTSDAFCPHLAHKEYNKHADIDLHGAPDGKTAALVSFGKDGAAVQRLSGVSAPLRGGGLYCFASCGGGVGHAALVVRDAARGGAEFAVAPYTRPLRMFEDAAVAEADSLQFVVPGGYHRGVAEVAGDVPLVVQRVAESGSWVRRDARVVVLGTTVAVPYGMAAFKLVRGGGSGGGAAAVPSLDAVPFEDTDRAALEKLLRSSGVEAAAPCTKTSLAAKGARAGCVYRLSGVSTVGEGESVVVPAGATLLMAADAVVVVKGTLRFEGTADTGVVYATAADAAAHWGGFVVHGGGRLVLRHTIVRRTGGLHHKREKNTGSHIKQVPAVTLKEDAAATLDHAYVVECDGPGFGAAKGARLEIVDSLLQDVLQGGECKICSFAMKNSAVMNVPNRRVDRYHDEDNDGLYLSGGDHTVQGTVIAFTADDGIDTGTPSSIKKHGGTLAIKDTIIDACQHEGLANSGVDRTIIVENSIVRRCQQGIEMGYSSSSTTCVVRHSVLHGNAVAVRYGDNYMKLSEGKLEVETSLARDSLALDVLNIVRKPAKPSHQLSVSTTHLLTHAKGHVVPEACGLSDPQGSGNTYRGDSDAPPSYSTDDGAGLTDAAFFSL